MAHLLNFISYIMNFPLGAAQPLSTFNLLLSDN